MSSPVTLWRLKPGFDRRFRSGHPWVYSNELAESPKGIEPGAPVELRDAKGQFLARGYGNPASLIAFRVLSREATFPEVMTAEALWQSLQRASRLRELAGMGQTSHRLCFGEADRLPGLVIDRYRVKQGWVFSVQAHTAGAQRMLGLLPEVLERLIGSKDFGIVVRNDIGVRKLEGLQEESPSVLRVLKGLDLAHARILVKAVGGGDPLEFDVDLIEGQKTGFFLDQFANIQLAAQRLGGLRPTEGKTLKIVDLCCYVGQWGAQLARVFKNAGLQVEVTAVDASEKALTLARANIERQGAQCIALKADVLRGLSELQNQSFDLVISDPPALIKGRKDLGPGTHAYLQLNTQVFRLARKGAGVVSCSCSSLLEEEEFLKALSKAAHRNAVQIEWTGRGCQSPDHPMLVEFPEGRYLKSWIGVTHG